MYRQVLRIVVVACLSGLMVSAAVADTEIRVNGQIRARTQADKKSFVPEADFREFSELRTRVQLTADISGNTKAVAQLQDSRTFGADNLSGTLNDGQKVDLHQGFIKIKKLWKGGPGLKAGRFEVNLGNQRVFGAVGWHNVGRSWEGFNTWLDGEKFRADVFWLKRREISSDTVGDFDIFVGNFTFKQVGTQALLAAEINDGQGSGESVSEGVNRYTFGIFGKHTARQFDFEYNAYYQFGTVDMATGTDLDIGAMLVTFEAGVTLDPEKKVRVAAGIDYASGDDDSADDKIESYNNLYYTGHKFRGHMDYFIGSSSFGLIDLMLRGQFAPVDGWLLKGDLHLFQSAADRQIGVNQSSKNLGTEIDLTVSTKRIQGVTLVAGASAFLPHEDFAGADNDPGLWGYGMLIANF